MSKPIDSQIRLIGSQSGYSNLRDWMKTYVVREIAFTEMLSTSVASGNAYVQLASSVFTGTKVAVGSATSADSGDWYYASPLTGATGATSNENDTDVDGYILNRVSIRDSVTHQPIRRNGFRVFGLLQVASTVSDGDTPATNDAQISFVYIASNGSVVTTALSDTVAKNIEFTLPRIFRRSGTPLIERREKNDGTEQCSNTLFIRDLIVTSPFAANEVITVSTGTGAATGASSVPALGQGSNSISGLGDSATAFNANNNLIIYRNGVLQVKGEDVVYDSSDSFHFAAALSVNDRISIFLTESCVEDTTPATNDGGTSVSTPASSTVCQNLTWDAADVMVGDLLMSVDVTTSSNHFDAGSSAGWNVIQSNVGNVFYTIYWKVATAADASGGANVTLFCTNGAVNTKYHLRKTTGVFTGLDVAQQLNSNSLTTPGITTTGDSFVLALFGNETGAAYTAVDNGFTVDGALVNGTASHLAASKFVDSAAVGAVTASGSASPDAFALVVAFK